MAGTRQELRGRSVHRSRPGVGSHKTPSEFCLRSHCQAFRRYASNIPSTPVSCWSDSRPSSRAQLELEASSRWSEQPTDRPASRGQQWHTTSWHNAMDNVRCAGSIVSSGHHHLCMQFFLNAENGKKRASNRVISTDRHRIFSGERHHPTPTDPSPFCRDTSPNTTSVACSHPLPKHNFGYAPV